MGVAIIDDSNTGTDQQPPMWKVCMRTIRARIAGVLIFLLTASPVAAWKIVPLISYSSSSGVLLGGVINHNMLPPFRPLAFSAMTYVYTDGSFFAEPQLIFPAGSGLLRFRLNYGSRSDRDFYGWGNSGDHDSSATYSSEVMETSLSYLISPLAGTALNGGLQMRHSSAYDRSESDLWESIPSYYDKEREGFFASSWTAGPFLDARMQLPGPVKGYAEGEIGLQTGSGFTYYDNRGGLALFFPVGPSTLPCCRILLGRQVSQSPFPFISQLGGSEGLRGYSDRRFLGDWTLLANAEIRQHLFNLKLDEENSFVVSLVLFGDAGQVADHLNQLEWDRFHLDGGLGARLAIPGGGALRADFALSPEGLGIQMGLGELF
jgi:hypothetical protein